MHAGFDGLDRIVLVVDGRGRTGQIVNGVHLHEQRKSHVVAHQLETPVVEQMFHILPIAAEKVVHAQHFAPLLQQAFAQVRTKKSGAAGHQNAGSGMHGNSF